jgi:hypothetical protein
VGHLETNALAAVVARKARRPGDRQAQRKVGKGLGVFQQFCQETASDSENWAVDNARQGAAAPAPTSTPVGRDSLQNAVKPWQAQGTTNTAGERREDRLQEWSSDTRDPGRSQWAIV